MSATPEVIFNDALAVNRMDSFPNGEVRGTFRAENLAELGKVTNDPQLIRLLASEYTIARYLGLAVDLNRGENEPAFRFAGHTIDVFWSEKAEAIICDVAPLIPGADLIVCCRPVGAPSGDYLAVEVLGWLPVKRWTGEIRRDTLRSPLELHYIGLDWIDRQLAALGVTLTLDGDKLMPSVKGKIPPELGALIRVFKPRLVMQREMADFMRVFKMLDTPLLGITMSTAADLRMRLWDHLNNCEVHYARGNVEQFREALSRARTALEAARLFAEENQPR
jgi:hypothetical protein